MTFLMMSHDQILDKHTIVDMFLMMSHDQILDKHTIVDMFCSKCTLTSQAYDVILLLEIHPLKTNQ